MTRIILTQCACSAAVAVLSFVGVRPVVMAPVLSVLIGSCWVLA